METISRKVTFKNSRGDLLAGIIDTTTATPAFTAVFAPCFTCVKESHAALKISRALAAHGGAVLRFDTTGTGSSGGDAYAGNFTTRIDDIISACQAIGAPDLVIGHSLSGTAALHAQENLSSLKMIATIGSPHSAPSVIEKFRRQGKIAEYADKVVIDVLGTPHTFAATFTQDLLNQKPPAPTNRPLAIFHAPNDTIVSFDNAPLIQEIWGAQANVIRLADDATHLFERGTTHTDSIAGYLAQRITG